MKISSSLIIDAPRDEVFEAFNDIEHAQQRISGIKSVQVLSDCRAGVGTRWRETRVMFGKEATEEMEVTQFDAPNAYAVEAESHGTHYTSRFRFEDEGDSRTRVSWSFEGKPTSTTAKLMSPLALLFKGTTRRMLEQDMLDLKTHLENTRAAPAV